MLNSILRRPLLLITVIFIGSFKHYAEFVALHFPQWNTQLEIVADFIEILRSFLLIIPCFLLDSLLMAIIQISTAAKRFTDSPAPGWVTQILHTPPSTTLLFILLIVYFVNYWTDSPPRSSGASNTPTPLNSSIPTSRQPVTHNSWFPWQVQHHVPCPQNADDPTAVQLFHTVNILPANYSLNHLNVHAGHTKFLLHLNTALNGRAFDLIALIDALQHTENPTHTIIRTISDFPLTIKTWKEFVKHYFQTFYSKKCLHQMFTKYHQKFYRETITTPGELKDFVNRWKTNSIYLLIEDIDEYFPFYLNFGPFSNLQFKKLLVTLYKNNIQEFIHLIGDAKSYSSLLGTIKKQKRGPQQRSSSTQSEHFTRITTPPPVLSPHNSNINVTTPFHNTNLPTVEATSYKTKTETNSPSSTSCLHVYSMTNFVIANKPETRDTTPNCSHSMSKPPYFSHTCVVDDNSSLSEYVTPAPGQNTKQLQKKNVHHIKPQPKVEDLHNDTTLQTAFIEPDDIHIEQIGTYRNSIQLTNIADQADKPPYLKRESPHYTSELNSLPK